MNKKTLFLILLGVLISPSIALAACTTLSCIAKTLGGTLADVGWFLVFVGFLIAGILYLTSEGSPEKTGTAKKAVVASVIGAILIILAQASGPIITVIKNAFGI